MDSAIVSGASGVAGAVVGALGGGLAERRNLRARDKRQARAAARLVRADMSIAAGHLGSAIEELLWWPFYDLTMPSWTTYRDLLAMELTAEHWALVSQSCIELQGVGEKTPLTPNYRTDAPMTLTATAAEHYATMHRNAVQAHDALARLAEEVGDNIEPAEPPAILSKPHVFSPKTPGDA